jgi:hypothetical protein
MVMTKSYLVDDSSPPKESLFAGQPIAAALAIIRLGNDQSN